MNIECTSNEITKIKADAIILFHFESVKVPGGDAVVVDRALGGGVSELIKTGEITGKYNETTIIHSFGKLPAGRVVILGLGKKKALTTDRLRGAMAEACRKLRDRAAGVIACSTGENGIASIDTGNTAQALTEGALLGIYTFRRHITGTENRPGAIGRLTITGSAGHESARKRGAREGEIIAEAVNRARDLVNEPGNHMTPALMAEAAERLAAEWELEIQVLEPEQMASLGMNALLAVARGSLQPPRFIILKYRGRVSDELDIALIGKGITFDSGGISLKPSEKMGDMKGDMAGGASVMAALVAASRLKLGINAAALIPATENMPGGGALKPGDVLTAMNGKTVEVLNTDAEGRLILADALCHAVKMKPGFIVDVATLTGACHVALGDFCTGLFSNDRKLSGMLVSAGEKTGEHIWPMPMLEEYRDLLRSEVADIKNIGNRWGGAVTAAKFLEYFVGKTRWAHLDIAGTSSTEKEKGYQVKGATGVPVRTLIRLVQDMSS